MAYFSQLNFDNGVPPYTQPYVPDDPFHDFGDRELSTLVSAAIRALSARGIPPAPLFHLPPPVTPVAQRQVDMVPQALPDPPRPPAIAPPVIPVPTRQPDMWENAKVEQIICSGLKPAYDGSSERLLPTLSLIHIRRKNEVWHPATFIKDNGATIDLVQNFSQVTEAIVFAQARRLWSVPDASLQSHTRGTEIYNSRLFGVFLMNSLTPEFAALLHSRIDSQFCLDGPLLLFTMCQNVHRNHLAFVENIKDKIRHATLAEYNNDVPSFVRFLLDNLKLITSTGATTNQHNDLVPHLLNQFRSTTIPVFQQTVLKWQRDYFEGKLELTPTTIVQKADNECQILKHAGQWVETIDPSIMAMHAALKSSTGKTGAIFQSLAANFSSIAQKQRDINRSLGGSSRPSSSSDTPEWLLRPPTMKGQIKHFNGRDWHFCTKCGKNGRWVCTHTDDTHDDTRRYASNDHNRRSPSPPSPTHHRSSYSSDNRPYKNRSRSPRRSDFADRGSRFRYSGKSRSRSPHSAGYDSDTSVHQRHISWDIKAPPTPVAQLSLLNSINMFLDPDDDEA